MRERINLVPRPTLADRIKRKVPFVALGLFLVCALVLGGYYWQLQSQVIQVMAEAQTFERRNEQLLSQQATVQQLAADLKRIKSDEAILRQEVAQLQKIPKQKKQYSNLLTVISQVIPASIRCEKVIMNERGGQVIGEALQYRDLPLLVKKLGEHPAFRSVSLQSIAQQEQAQGQETTGLFSFTVTFQL